MVDDAELANLDPFDLLDAEAARLDAHLSTLPDEGWSRPSRCEGWSVRDVVAHLSAVEDYHRACLDGGVEAFIGEFGARGANDLDSANALGIADRADRSASEVLADWRDASAESRRRFRERGDGVIDTFVGDYPNRWQAFHVASELATHADDVFVPVSPEEQDERLGWRARFSRFALAEGKPDVVITVDAGHTQVRGNGVEVDVDDDELVEGVASRLDDTSRLDSAARAMLSATP